MGYPYFFLHCSTACLAPWYLGYNRLVAPSSKDLVVLQVLSGWSMPMIADSMRDDVIGGEGVNMPVQVGCYPASRPSTDHESMTSLVPLHTSEGTRLSQTCCLWTETSKRQPRSSTWSVISAPNNSPG